MSEDAGARAQLTRLWTGMTLAQRASLVGSVVLVLGVLAWLVLGVQRDTYRTVVASSDPAVQADVVDALSQAGIRHRIRASSRVEVPQHRLDEARMVLARQGLPQQGGMGYELFDDAGFGMTAYTQQVNLQRALENELSRSIRTLESVEAARVHLVLPRETLFTESMQSPSASVVLMLRAGAVPSDRQIEAIRFLVGSAVEGLDPRSVTVVDNRGTMLARSSSSGGRDGGGGSEEVMTMRRQLELELASRVQSLLEPLVGMGNVHAQVAVELDTSQVFETFQEFDPEQLAVRSEQRTEESSRRGEAGGAVGAGVQANLEGVQEGGRGRDLETSRSSEILNYEVNLRMRELRRSGFRVEGLSVAVVLNQRMTEQGPGAARTPAEIERLTGLVRNAVGAREDRRDRVVVLEEAFRVAPDEGFRAPPLWERPEVLWPVTRILLLIVVLIGLAVLLRGVLRNVREVAQTLAPARPARAAGALDEERTDPETGIVIRPSEGLPQLFNARGPSVELPGGPSPQEELRQQVMALGSSDLDKTAEIISSWIRMDEGRERRI